MKKRIKRTKRKKKKSNVGKYVAYGFLTLVTLEDLLKALSKIKWG